MNLIMTNQYGLSNAATIISRNRNKPSITERINDYFNKESYDCYIACYNSFPFQKTAEYELLLRLILACKKLHVGFFVIHNDNIIRNTKLAGIHINAIDTSKILFILSLHIASPKTSKHFTIMPLWNPIHFIIHASNSFLSMDGYLSAYSENIDNYIKSKTDKPFLGHLNTSLFSPILDISIENYTCFYVGTNWEKMNNYLVANRQMVIDLVKKMDNLGMVAIYGPKKSWEGFHSYVREIAFDGTSIVYEIKKCGICLILSSHHHIEDKVCSNRLFEGLAAGVPIISDKNPFIQTWFGDNVFYIDHSSPDIAVQQIQNHIDYIKNNPEETLQKMQRSRDIFLNHFLMDKQLSHIVENVKQTCRTAETYEDFTTA